MNSICKWKPSAIFPDNYEVSDSGDVKNTRGRILKPAKDKNGYLYYVLCVSGVRRAVKAHRLVAMTYIPKVSYGRLSERANGKRPQSKKFEVRYVKEN